jgi:hypothetical protein
MQMQDIRTKASSHTLVAIAAAVLVVTVGISGLIFSGQVQVPGLSSSTEQHTAVQAPAVPSLVDILLLEDNLALTRSLPTGVDRADHIVALGTGTVGSSMHKVPSLETIQFMEQNGFSYPVPSSSLPHNQGMPSSNY